MTKELQSMNDESGIAIPPSEMNLPGFGLCLSFVIPF
jgi:hypothetical protein